jgi:hypothetical protein
VASSVAFFQTSLLSAPNSWSALVSTATAVPRVSRPPARPALNRCTAAASSSFSGPLTQNNNASASAAASSVSATIRSVSADFSVDVEAMPGVSTRLARDSHSTGSVTSMLRSSPAGIGSSRGNVVPLSMTGAGFPPSRRLATAVVCMPCWNT